MGEKQEVGLYYKADEEWVKFDGLTQVPEFHPDQDFDCSSYVISSWDAEFTGTLKPNKNLRCKTRKRFVKLLMSIGFQRDRAVSFAEDTRECMPYSAAWVWISLMGGIPFVTGRWRYHNGWTPENIIKLVRGYRNEN